MALNATGQTSNESHLCFTSVHEPQCHISIRFNQHFRFTGYIVTNATNVVRVSIPGGLPAQFHASSDIHAAKTMWEEAPLFNLVYAKEIVRAIVDS